MPYTKITWAQEAVNFYTWNCTSVSPGCKHCYARERSAQYPKNSAGGLFSEKPQLRERAFEELRQTPKGKVVFVNSHSDTFHESVPVGWLRRIFQHMNQRPDLIFLLLTKRPQTAAKFHEGAFGIHWSDNIWLGTSIESQTFYAPRMNALLKTAAAHKFVSFEPLLSMVRPDDLLKQTEWVIVGGESGEDFRPFNKAWAGAIRDFCQSAHIPFYFKQGGGLYADGDRLLEGRIWDETPHQFAELSRKYEIGVEQIRLF